MIQVGAPGAQPGPGHALGKLLHSTDVSRSAGRLRGWHGADGITLLDILELCHDFWRAYAHAGTATAAGMPPLLATGHRHGTSMGLALTGAGRGPGEAQHTPQGRHCRWHCMALQTKTKQPWSMTRTDLGTEPPSTRVLVTGVTDMH